MPAGLRRAVRRARRRVEIVRRTGQLRPDHIALAASGHVIYVDPEDERGREIVRGLGRGHQPALVALWRQAVEVVEPALVLDIGANYGELVLNARYPAGSLVLAIEANPRVAPLLRRSIAAHPDADRIELHDVLAGPTDEGSDHLLVDPGWSGTAGTSLDHTRDGRTLVDLTIAVRTVDALVGDRSNPGPLLVKIDTEGSEGQVLSGMGRVLTDATAVVALVEFDPVLLRRQGSDPDQIFGRLRAIGRCWSVDWEGRTVPALEPPPTVCDLLVVSDDLVAGRMGLGDS